MEILVQVRGELLVEGDRVIEVEREGVVTCIFSTIPGDVMYQQHASVSLALLNSLSFIKAIMTVFCLRTSHFSVSEQMFP